MHPGRARPRRPICVSRRLIKRRVSSPARSGPIEKGAEGQQSWQLVAQQRQRGALSLQQPVAWCQSRPAKEIQL